MRILAIVRNVALIICAVTLTLTTLYFANEYRELRADLAALRALPGELRERVRDRIEGTGERFGNGRKTRPISCGNGRGSNSGATSRIELPRARREGRRRAKRPRSVSREPVAAQANSR